MDDEAMTLEYTVNRCLELEQIDSAEGFTRPREALEWLKDHPVDIAFLDIELVGCNGLDLAGSLMQCSPRCNVIFLTCHPEYAREALELFCSGYVMKPLSPAKIREQATHLRFPVPGLSVAEDA